MDDRAVTEVVGFVLSFALVLSTISIVYVGGFAALEETRVHEQNTNAERAFDVLANNLQEVARDKAPSRATEIKLADSGITVRNERRIEIGANGSSVAAQPRSIVYESGDDTEIVYELGAVFRVEPGGTVMLREPDLVFDERTTVVRYVEPKVPSGATRSVGGSTTVLVRAERSQARVLMAESDPGTAKLNLTTSPSRADTWQQYLEAELDESCSQADTGPDAVRVHCEFEPDRLYVARTRLTVTLN